MVEWQDIFIQHNPWQSTTDARVIQEIVRALNRHMNDLVSQIRTENQALKERIAELERKIETPIFNIT